MQITLNVVRGEISVSVKKSKNRKPSILLKVFEEKKYRKLDYWM